MAHPRDLRALNARTRHQALLVEDEGVDVLRERRAGDRLALPLVHQDDARPDPDLPAVAPVEVLERLVVHQEERVAKANRIVCVRRQRVLPGDVVVRDARQVVVQERPPLQQAEPVGAEAPAVGDEDAFGAVLGDLDLDLEAGSLVLDDRRSVLRVLHGLLVCRAQR